MPGTVEVSLGEHVLSVPEGGYYDRYRMQADLDQVAEDPRVPSVDFFRSLPKRVVESPIGPTSTPNFYYAMRMVQIAMLAPVAAVRDRLPQGLAPLQPAPGLGLVVLALFAYDVCDVDPYDEVTVAIGVRPPRHGGPAELDFLQSRLSGTVYGYPLSLPVDTEIARVRGVHGYGLPKWRTDIDISLEPRIVARVADDAGGTDIALDLPLPRQVPHPSGSKVRTTIALSRLDGVWHESRSILNLLSSGSSLLPRGVEITHGSGRLSDDLASLRPIRTLAVEATTSAQLALNMPVPTSIG
ncbi:MAG: acetoacetate decarboxylase family protein [Solirubrobacterales bacterium]